MYVAVIYRIRRVSINHYVDPCDHAVSSARRLPVWTSVEGPSLALWCGGI